MRKKRKMRVERKLLVAGWKSRLSKTEIVPTHRFRKDPSANSQETCDARLTTHDDFMQRETETLKVGSQAPVFTLLAANRGGTFTVSDLLSRGALIVEFLRGTW